MLLASACLEHAWNGAAKKTLWIWGGTDAHPAVSPIALSFLPTTPAGCCSCSFQDPLGPLHSSWLPRAPWYTVPYPGSLWCPKV